MVVETTVAFLIFVFLLKIAVKTAPRNGMSTARKGRKAMMLALGVTGPKTSRCIN